MEPLSKSLRDWLIACKLCTRADLRRCKPRVRQFARDVPAFDSVWIDALIHNRKLTPFQAKVLGSGTPHALKIGPWVLVDQLGSGASATFLAREHGSNRKAVLKRIRPDQNAYQSAMAALQQLVAGGKDQTEPSLALPQSCIPAHHELITISPYRLGPTLKEFLVRRGRLSADVVSAILHQLIAGLATLEARGIVHGDVQLKNVRISKRGQASLVDAGVRPALRPVLNIHDRRGPDEYDGIAPELIGTGNPADVRSEFYALGCLAWHLLAGRPPFPTGDPLAKLQAHQTRRIPDVRDIAPDTPRIPIPTDVPRRFRNFAIAGDRPAVCIAGSWRDSADPFSRASRMCPRCACKRNPIPGR